MPGVDFLAKVFQHNSLSIKIKSYLHQLIVPDKFNIFSFAKRQCSLLYLLSIPLCIICFKLILINMITDGASFLIMIFLVLQPKVSIELIGKFKQLIQVLIQQFRGVESQGLATKYAIDEVEYYLFLMLPLFSQSKDLGGALLFAPLSLLVLDQKPGYFMEEMLFSSLLAIICFHVFPIPMYAVFLIMMMAIYFVTYPLVEFYFQGYSQYVSYCDLFIKVMGIGSSLFYAFKKFGGNNFTNLGNDQLSLMGKFCRTDFLISLITSFLSTFLFQRLLDPSTNLQSFNEWIQVLRLFIVCCLHTYMLCMIMGPIEIIQGHRYANVIFSWVYYSGEYVMLSLSNTFRDKPHNSSWLYHLSATTLFKIPVADDLSVSSLCFRSVMKGISAIGCSEIVNQLEHIETCKQEKDNQTGHNNINFVQ
ncbi:MAG TPA: hypothetical protein QF353_00955 [Gammaproteobacteria bacterium]|nr:hypothetical protein [Gammaproteobacteria bacterium]